MAGPKKAGRCLGEMVYVAGGSYEDQRMPALCIDKHEFTNEDGLRLSTKYAKTAPIFKLLSFQSPEGFNDPKQPKVNISGHDARQICEAQRKRLPTPEEWAYVASKRGTKAYSTRSGTVDHGIHHTGDATRKVCEARGYYVEYGGREVCDMNGNVSEWTYKPSWDKFFFSGGDWAEPYYSRELRASYHSFPLPHANSRGTRVGFRCVAPPSKK